MRKYGYFALFLPAAIREAEEDVKYLEKKQIDDGFDCPGHYGQS
jgi:hypothetical protein